MLSRLDQFQVFTPDGNEEVGKLLTALEAEGRRVRIGAAVGKVARIFVYGKIRTAADAVRGNKIP